MQTEFVDYQSDDFLMQAFVARQDSISVQPIVLVIHDWSGCREFAQEKAKYFAEQGYIGFAVDLYGKGNRGSDSDNSINQDLMTPLMQDRALIVKRLQAALECAKKLSNVNSAKIMLIGFCFGGLCALDFARAGANVSGVVSVHGLFFKPEQTTNVKIRAKILALHGYEDKMCTPEILAEFHSEMASRGADWQTHVFGATTHAFTNPRAQNPAAGLLYNSSADRRTWSIVESFVKEIFA